MEIMPVLRQARKVSNTLALPLGLAGLAAALWLNYRQWQNDLAMLEQASPAEPPTSAPNLDMPKVSVLVAAWNEARNIAAHLESFLALRYPNKELILCAGGNDTTLEIAQRYAGPQVRVLAQVPGQGKQRALHQCVAHASGDLIYLTDADCVFDDLSFERTLEPLIHEGEQASTGSSKPLPSQQHNTFIVQRWFTEIYHARWAGRYSTGMLGRNAAIHRDLLRSVGDFAAVVPTGTDYYLAQQVAQQGQRIRSMHSSVVATEYAPTLRKYYTQQSRWLRNVVMYGRQFGRHDEIIACVTPSLVGLLMLAGPLFALLAGGSALALWLVAWVHATLSRVRYISIGQRLAGVRYPAWGYALLPLYLLTDFSVWGWTLLQYPFQQQRNRW